HAQLEDSNELFQKLLEDLQIIKKELTECNHPTFFDNNEKHSVQYKEYLENPSNEIATSNSNQEKEGPLQDFDICQLIREECCIELCEEQKQNMENTILELVEICQQKELYCMHDNVDDLIESALNFKEQCCNQNFNENYYPHNLPSFLCCDNCGGPHKSFQCQSMNQNYFEPNPCYDFKSSSFDQFQPPQYFDVHQPSKEISIDELKIMIQSYCERMNQQREQEALLASQREQELREQEQAAQEKKEPSQNSGFRQLIREICGTKVCEKQKQNTEETMLELLEVCRQKELCCMHNNVDDLIESALNSKLLSINLKSQRLNKEKQEVNNIIEQPTKQIIPTKIDPHYFNAESNVIESLLNRDTLIDSSPKFDYLLEEFSRELAHKDPIPPRIEEADFDLEEEIRHVENFLYDNSSPQPPEELNAKIDDTILESLSPSPIPFEDSDSQIEEIDLFFDTDDLMPPGIEYDNYHFLEELLSNDTLPLPENESSNFDHHDDPSFPRPPPEPPDVEVFFDFEPDTGVLTAKVAEDIS
nr:hypothetical protein [Tanacetum cinerariifolium]